MPFDPTKPVQTRDGRPARIICTDRKGGGLYGPIIALHTDNDGIEYSTLHSADGKATQCGSGRYDLVNIPTKRTGWINVYNNGSVIFGGEIQPTKEKAQETAILMKSYVTTIQIEWEE